MRGWGLAILLLAGASVTASQVGPSQPAGLTAVLILDVTASVSRVPLPLDQRFAQVFNAFLMGLKPSDRGAVGVLSGRVRFGKVTGDHRELTAGLRLLLQASETDRLGPSPIWDAVDEAITIAAADPSGRPVVVVFSDGKSNGNTHGLDEVIAHAKALHTTIDAVVEGPPYRMPVGDSVALDPADMIGRLTGATGGIRLLDRASDLRQRSPGLLVSRIMDARHAMPSTAQ